MKDDDNQVVSRRRWLGQMSVPLAAASIGSFVTRVHAKAADESAGARVYDVRAFGANGDGATRDTAAVQAAIDACHRERGGVVLVPAGDFVVGTLELKSNVTLHLAAAGRLLGSPNINDYRAGNEEPPRDLFYMVIHCSNLRVGLARKAE